MYRLNYFFIFSIILAYCNAKTVTSTKSKWKCNEADKKKIDTIVARIMTYGRTDRKFPVNTEEMKVYCKEGADLRARLTDYKETCLKDQPKQIVGVIVFSIRSLSNIYCKNVNTKRTKDLIASANCANNATQGYKGCNDDYVNLLYAAYDTTDSKKRLAQMCCGYVEIFKCIERQAKPLSVCTDNFIEINKQYIHGFFDNAITILCGEHQEGSDKCDRFKWIKKTGNKKYPVVESYFHPLVHTLANL